MILFKKLTIKELLIHLLFWALVWFFFVYFFSYNTTDKRYISWFSGSLLPITMFTTYMMVYKLIPDYLLAKKYFHFTLYSFYILVFTAYVVVLMIYACLIFILKFKVSSIPPMAKNFVSVMILILLIVGVVSLINLLNHNFQTISKYKELQNKILETQLQLKEQELNYLKKQIHPHFLFNTLNTIYGFALKQSKHTPEIILKLSNLLDYILYQVNKPNVSLQEEVSHIKEYIELEKIRFQETLNVSFEANEIQENIRVAPMLLIPFVENAFKHGSLQNGALSIAINIRVEEMRLYFSITNTALSDDTGIKQGGIGLENIKKRLELHYPNKYLLDVINKDNRFIAELSIFDLNIKDNG